MKQLHVIFSIGLVVCCAAHDESQPPQTGSARSRLVLPKVFDFEQFKSLFTRHYLSITEELVRKKLYLGRAFRAFISAISYKHRKSNSYLGINDMSDWTPKELRDISLDNLDNLNSIANEPNEIPVAEIGDISRKLNEFVEQHKGEPGSAEIAIELSRQKRRKRDINNNKQRDLSMDDLLPSDVLPPEPIGLKKLPHRVPTNNPHYEQPELISYGFNAGQPANLLPADESDKILQLPGAEFVKNVLQGAFSNFVAGASLLLKPDEKNLLAVPADQVYVDHRQTDCFFPPRDQKKCGSCYVFSTLALYEWLHCRQTGYLVAFSPQYPLDCGVGNVKGLNGCNGGHEVHVTRFVDKYGLELKLDYPYKGKAEQCPYANGTDPKVMGRIKILNQQVNMLDLKTGDLEVELKRKPLLIGVQLSESFYEFKGGVDDGFNCREGQVKHALVLVGSGIEDGNEYWLLRNSHGRKYGVEGHYKLNKKADCFYEGKAWLIKANFPTFKADDTSEDDA